MKEKDGSDDCRCRLGTCDHVPIQGEWKKNSEGDLVGTVFFTVGCVCVCFLERAEYSEGYVQAFLFDSFGISSGNRYAVWGGPLATFVKLAEV